MDAPSLTGCAARDDHEGNSEHEDESEAIDCTPSRVEWSGVEWSRVADGSVWVCESNRTRAKEGEISKPAANRIGSRVAAGLRPSLSLPSHPSHRIATPSAHQTISVRAPFVSISRPGDRSDESERSESRRRAALRPSA